MKKIRKHLVILIFAISLTGCFGTSSPTKHYSLIPSEHLPSTVENVKNRISVGPVELAQYLRRDEIVTRKDGHEIVLADFDHWAEPLENSIARRLADSIETSMPGRDTIAFPNMGSNEGDLNVALNVERFEQASSGEITMVVLWSVSRTDGKNLIPIRKTILNKNIEKDSISKYVTGLSDLVGDLGVQIAASLEIQMRKNQGKN